MTETVERDGLKPVKSADRALEILEHLATAGERRSLGELARHLGIPKSSLHGLLRTLESRGWVQSDVGGNRFGLGVRALLVGASYVDSDDVVTLATGILDWLVTTLDETVHLGRLDGPDIIYLAKRESSQALRLFSAIGRRLPAHATALGKAVLAERHAGEDLETLLPGRLASLTRNTITDPVALQRELDRTRERGFAVDNEENTLGIRCFAVPLRTGAQVHDAISCSVPVIRLDAGRETEIIEQLRAAQRSVEDQLRRSGRS